MNVEHTGGNQATRSGREKRLSRMALLAVGVACGLAVFVGLGRVVVRGQSAKTTPFLELTRQLGGGSQIGVTVRDVEESDVKREKLPATAGAVVDEVRSESPASKAGVKAGDVIVAFDGENVRSARHFARLIDETPHGREVDATVVRAGERINMKVTPTATESFAFGLDRRDYRDGSYVFSPRNPGLQNLDRLGNFYSGNLGDLQNRLTARRFALLTPGPLGVDVQELTGQLAEYFGTTGGVLVTAVDDGTPGRTAGIRAGDVITKINGEAIRDANDLRRRLVDASGDTRVTLVRDRKEQTITIKLEDERMVSRERIRR
jgi:serine protease Do